MAAVDIHHRPPILYLHHEHSLDENHLRLDYGYVTVSVLKGKAEAGEGGQDHIADGILDGNNANASTRLDFRWSDPYGRIASSSPRRR